MTKRGERGHTRDMGDLGGTPEVTKVTAYADAGVPLGLSLPNAGVSLDLRRAALPQRVQVVLGTRGHCHTPLSHPVPPQLQPSLPQQTVVALRTAPSLYGVFIPV